LEKENPVPFVERSSTPISDPMIVPPIPTQNPTSTSPQDDMVALLIPSNMLNSSILAPHLQNSSAPSLQVLRQLLTLYMWPMNSSN